MSLKKLFNAKYFYQNVKKSAAVLALFCGIIPILNTIIFLLQATSGNSFLVTLENISIFTCIGMFIFPFILSACLFDFIFKKKSVDFIGSMPIGKKTIFTTNMIGGSFILFSMLLITALLMLIASLFLPSVSIPLAMLFDYFILFFVGYLFCYAATTLAFSLCGNLITGLAVTLLLLFFIPFINNYIRLSMEPDFYEFYIKCEEESCIPKYFDCQNLEADCILHQQNQEYNFLVDNSSLRKKDYTLPYHYLSYVIGMNYTDDEVIIYNTKQVLTTLLFTMIYIVLGYYFFKKKKLEISETSFGNFNVHLFVKFLTLFPLCIFVYELISTDSIFLVLFIFILLIAYYFIFDLITRRKIEHLGKSIVAFFVSCFIIFNFCLVIDHFEKDSKTILKSNSIQKIELEANYMDYNFNVTIKDRDFIMHLLSLLTETSKGEDAYYGTNLKLYQNNKVYETTLMLPQKELTSLLESVSEYIDTDKNIISNAYAVELDSILVNKDEKDELIKLAKESLDSKNDVCKVSSYLSFYDYKNHQRRELYVPTCKSLELQKFVSNYDNKRVITSISNSRVNQIHVISEEDDMPYLLDHYLPVVSNFLKQYATEEIDLSKDVLKIFVNTYDGTIPYYTNRKDEFYELINTLREKAKDSEGYQNYMKSILGDEDE